MSKTSRKMLRKLMFILLLSIGALALVVWSLGRLRSRFFYDPKTFGGDGIISDNGFWSYPRFRISFPGVSLTHSSAQRFQLKGLPPELWTFGLRIETSEDADLIRRCDPFVAVRLVDSRGMILRDVHAPLSSWELASNHEVYFWHDKWRDVTIADGQRLTIEFVVNESDMDGDLKPFLVQPFLQGGGNELP